MIQWLNTISGVALHLAMPPQPYESRAHYAPFSPRWFRLAMSEATR